MTIRTACHDSGANVLSYEWLADGELVLWLLEDRRIRPAPDELYMAVRKALREEK